MKKLDIVNKILTSRDSFTPKFTKVIEYASASLALCKYWGKKNEELHIPTTNNISIPLTGKGATSSILCNNSIQDTQIKINELDIDKNTKWGKKLLNFIKLFLPTNNSKLKINISLNIETSAGLASSSCIYASLIKSFNKLYLWNISKQKLSILARLGSGSAARAIFENHFIENFSGNLDDGMDSYAQIISCNSLQFANLTVGLILINKNKKYISSSEAMKLSLNSPFYNAWKKQTNKDFIKIKHYIMKGSFIDMAKIVENNSLMLHSLMLATRPSILYTEAKTLKIIKKIWQIREKYKIPIFFTQDAGANIKILYQSFSSDLIKKHLNITEEIKIFD